MTYQALARKWRPKRFAELVGQRHVVGALTHALSTGRVHHAFLFTGTRGVGKTTIARIFAKSLNCERGVSAEPCGVCSACVDIDAGRFMDLVEIDAASNTSVDDVRQLIENAQYRPARGEYKVYLIDEVHMLSKNAFNALLKTLEEPPEHAKFLLATTDPQKLPITVLSRCLQFNLKRLSDDEIAGQLVRILEAEAIAAEPEALADLARAGQGSLRDALSLLDQAIAFGGGRVDSASVRSMLGTIDRGQVHALVDAIVSADGAALAAAIDTIVAIAPDFGAVLDDISLAFHRVQLAQLLPESVDRQASDAGWIDGLAAAHEPDNVQLWYQLALSGKRDLPLAPSARAGFEMAVLRLLAFAPAGAAGAARPAPRAPSTGNAPPPKRAASAAASPRSAASASMSAHDAAGVAAPSTPALSPAPAAVVTAAAAPKAPNATWTLDTVADSGRWSELIAAAELKGPARELAMNALPVGLAGTRLSILLDPAHEALATPRALAAVGAALAKLAGVDTLTIAIADQTAKLVPATTPAARARAASDARHRAAAAAVDADPLVQSLLADFGARVDRNSIRPKE